MKKKSSGSSIFFLSGPKDIEQRRKKIWSGLGSSRKRSLLGMGRGEKKGGCGNLVVVCIGWKNNVVVVVGGIKARKGSSG